MILIQAPTFFYHLGDPYSGAHFYYFFTVFIVLIRVPIFIFFNGIYRLGDHYSGAHFIIFHGVAYSGL